MPCFDRRTVRTTLLAAAAAGLIAWTGFGGVTAHAQPLPDINVEDARTQARTGDPTKQAALGMAMLLGRRTEKNAAEGLHWLKLAADQDNPLGLVFLGYAHLNAVGTDKNVREGVALTHG